MGWSEIGSAEPEPHSLTTDSWRLTTAFLLLSTAPTFVPIDSRGSSVLVWVYTGKEVV